MTYYQLYDRTDSDFEADAITAAAVSTQLRCPECGTFKKDIQLLPDVVTVRRPGKFAVSFVVPILMGAVASDFLAIIGAEAVHKCLKIGRLLNLDQDEITGCSGYIGVERILLRGGPQSQHRVCNGCGAMLYTPVPVHRPYVTAAAVAASLPVYVAGPQRLVVNEEIRARLGNKWDKLLKIYPLPVRDHAEDGLPDDLSLFPTADKLNNYKPNPPPYYTPLTQ